MINKVKDFYFKYAPTFTERYKKDEVLFLFSKYVDDVYSNIAIVNSDSNLDMINKEFSKRHINSLYYSFVKPNGCFEISYVDDYLIFQNIDKLFAKYSKLKSKDIELVEVNNETLRKEYMIINDCCYKAESYDNPYSNLDNLGYCKSVLDFQSNETETKTLLYIIKYKSQNVGCINLTIKDDLAYISGLAILEQFRKTKIFLAMIDVLHILKSNNVKDIFCVTELNEYPDKLYKKLGFKSIAIAYAYKNK